LCPYGVTLAAADVRFGLLAAFVTDTGELSAERSPTVQEQTLAPKKNPAPSAGFVFEATE